MAHPKSLPKITGVKTAKDVIMTSSEWAFCRLCYDGFRRLRQTLRYCAHCENGFCEGEHGNFAFGHGVCVICGAKKNYTCSAVYDANSKSLI
jgi:hypothetical protein